jgi:predicted amidohydrolase
MADPNPQSIDFQSLLANIEKCGDIVALGELLLLFCRANLTEVKSGMEAPRFRPERLTLLAGARDLCRDIHSDLLTEHQASAFATLLRASVEALPPTVAVRVVAEALDSELGDRFAACFIEQRRGLLSPGSAIAVPSWRPKTIHGDQLSSKPSNQADDWDALEYLRLLPEATGIYEIEVAAGHSKMLSALRVGGRAAIGVVNHDFSTDLTCDVRQEEGSFFNVRPSDEALQCARLLKLLNAAEREAIQILVLPELCLTAEVRSAVSAWYAQEPRQLRLALVGSEHLLDEGEPRNRSTTLGWGLSAPWCHNKITPLNLWGMLREAIVTAPSRIRICYCGDWTFATLICKDFLDPNLESLLRQLRVRLLLVCALSEKMDGFEVQAQHLAYAAQTTVIVANLPLNADAAGRGLVAVPVPGGLYTHPASPTQTPDPWMIVHAFGSGGLEVIPA